MRIGLFWRLVAAMLMVSLVPLVGITAWVRQVNEAELLKLAQQNLTLELDKTALSIEAFVDESREVQTTLAVQASIISMDPAQQKPFLQATVKVHPEMMVLQTSDLSGMNVAKNDDSALNNISDRVWFQTVAKGGDLGYQTLISKTTGKPGLVVAVPVKDGSKLKGVLSATIDLKAVSDMVTASKVGKTGFAWLVDAEDKAMAHPDKTLVEKQASLKEQAAVQRARAGQTDVTTLTEGSTRWLTATRVLPQGWALILQMDEAEALASVHALSSRSQMVMYVVAAVVLIVALGFTLALTRPISKMSKYVDRLAGGDFTQPLDMKRRDELGMMATALNRLQANMREHVGSVKLAVAGVGESGKALSDSATVSARAREAIASAFADTLSGVETATAQQQEQLSSAKETVGELVAAVEQISLSASHQAAEVSQAASVVQEVGTQADTVASGVERLAVAVDRVAVAGNTGKTTVEGALAGIRSTNESVSRAVGLTRELGTRSEAIGTILSEIAAIAAQTNLLALNAAIEAARAGEAGRGFSVVAEEVRKLADRSVHSAQEIGTILASLQEGVRQVSGAMEQGAETARAGARQAAEAHQVLESILEAVSASSAEAELIRSAVASLTEGQAALGRTFQNLAAVAEENSASAEEMAAGGEAVRTAIGSLDSLAMANFAAIQGVGKDLQQISGAVDQMVKAVEGLQTVNSQLSESVANLKV